MQVHFTVTVQMADVVSGLHRQKIFMNGGVVRKLRVKCRHKLRVLTRSNYSSANCCENLGTVIYLLGKWGADKCHRNRSDAVKIILRVEASELSAVGVSADTDVHSAKAAFSVLDIAG